MVGNQSNDFVTFAPDEFIRLASEGEVERKAGGREILIKGTVDLRQHPFGRKIREIPECAITGDLLADSSCLLEICRCRVGGAVELDDCPIREFVALPDAAGSVAEKLSARRCVRLRRVSGNFANDVDLSESGIVELGRDFVCAGSLFLAGCQQLQRIDCQAGAIIAVGSTLREIGANTAAGSLSVEGCRLLKQATPVAGLKWAKYDGSGVRDVHQQFRCDGTAYFRRCKNLTSLSGAFQSLEVSMAPLDNIVGLRGVEVTFSDCPQLPASVTGLRVRAVAFVRCGIEKIPSGIDTGVQLGVIDCHSFSKFPDLWEGDINLSGLSSLEGIPSHFQGGGTLSLSECENLQRVGGRIGGSVYLLHGLPKLTELDDDLVIDGDLLIEAGCNIQKIGCKVLGGVSARQSDIKESKASFSVGGDADFSGSASLTMFRGEVGGDTILDHTQVFSLGADFSCKGDLTLRTTLNLSLLNCFVGGNVIVFNSSLRETGPAFQCGCNFVVQNCPNFVILKGLISGRARLGREIRAKMAALRAEKGRGRGIPLIFHSIQCPLSRP